MKAYHCGVAAEAYAAALFAHAGCDVLVQYGANQPEYDLLVVRGKHRVKVSVKGSQDGGWLLAARYKRAGRTYAEAIDAWEQGHADKTVLYCFVQFKGVTLGAMPRVYLAKVDEVAAYLKRSRAGQGHLSLRENYTWRKGPAAGTVDCIPQGWRFEERIKLLM